MTINEEQMFALLGRLYAENHMLRQALVAAQLEEAQAAEPEPPDHGGD